MTSGVRQDRSGESVGSLHIVRRLDGYPTYYLCLCEECGASVRVSHSNLLRKTGKTGCRECYMTLRRKQLPLVRDCFTITKKIDGQRFLKTCNRCGREQVGSLHGGKKSCRHCKVYGLKKASPLITIDGVDWTYPEIAELLGVSRQRVFQLRDRGRLEERIAEATAETRR